MCSQKVSDGINVVSFTDRVTLPVIPFGSQYIFLTFISDFSVVRSGFELSYTQVRKSLDSFTI